MIVPAVRSNVFLLILSIQRARLRVKMNGETGNPKNIVKIGPKLTAHRRRGHSEFHYTFEERLLSSNPSAFIEKLSFHEFLSPISGHPLEKVVLLTHGFGGGVRSRSKWMIQLKDELLRMEGGGQGVLVLTLDWSKGTRRRPLQASPFKQAVGNTLVVSTFLSDVISALRNALPPSVEVHGVGHCLGSHLLGQFGRGSGKALDRITALDPPALDEGAFAKGVALTKGDAPIIDVIYTYPEGCNPPLRKGLPKSLSASLKRLNTSKSANNLTKSKTMDFQDGEYTDFSSGDHRFSNGEAGSVKANEFATAIFYPEPEESPELSSSNPPPPTTRKFSLGTNAFKKKKSLQPPPRPQSTDLFIRSVSRKEAFIVTSKEDSYSTMCLSSMAEHASLEVQMGFHYRGAPQGVFYFKSNSDPSSRMSKVYGNGHAKTNGVSNNGTNNGGNGESRGGAGANGFEAKRNQWKSLETF